MKNQLNDITHTKGYNMIKVEYVGDVSLEHGGTFFDASNWDEYGFASAVRVQPCKDAGLPDNQYWIEEIIINEPSDDMLVECLKESGLEIPSSELNTTQIIELLVSNGRFEQDRGITVQLGKNVDPYYNGVESPLPDTVLHGNASLKKYALTCFR